jgi:segregation and condensation protein B
MSLKAKLEAVIYAAEEPVTLAQLAVLFAEEALAWKAEQAILSASAAPESEGDADAPAAIELADSGIELGAELTSLLLVPARKDETPEDISDGEATAAEPETATPADSDSGQDSGPASDPELEAVRQRRRREREVREILRGLLDSLMAEYAGEGRGLEIREIAGGFRMGTKPETHDAVRSFVKSSKPPMKLSLPALETLAVVAYKQPVTAPEVGEIRGVDSAGVLGSLMSRKLIATAGRKQVVGRPILYKTTKEFLLRFGLKDVNELPSMEEFEKMAALELSEESLDETSATGAELSGDLFSESESAATGAGENAEAEAGQQEIEAQAVEAHIESPTPTAETF